ncbi:endoplasmic reticulum-resident kdel protein [Aspergillus aurantiobrunneus]
MHLPRILLHRPASVVFLAFLAFLAILTIAFVFRFYSGDSIFGIISPVGGHGSSTVLGPNHHNDPDSMHHPIDWLVHDAERKWERLLLKQSHRLQDATREYRQRRGRHPPPGFDKWFAFAQEKKAILIEDLFDQIYDDLSPYWAMEPREMRRRASGWDPRIILRNHHQTPVGGAGPGWMEGWMDLISTIQQFLPDMDIPVNGMDEPRIIISWEALTEFRAQDHIHQLFLPSDTAVDEYMTLPAFDPAHPPELAMPTFLGADHAFWEIMRHACPPESPGRSSNIPKIDFAHPPPEFFNYRNFSSTGYVEDFERSKDPCWRAELQALHGSFIEPISVSTSHELTPLFGGSKLTVNNEILIPPAMYWADNPVYSGGRENQGPPWADKTDNVLWRGIASGGRNREETWTGFQRHRLLSMLNGTQVAATNGSSSPGLNFRQPNYKYYNVWAALNGTLPEWLDEHCDVGFVDLVCMPLPDEAHGGPTHCPYTDPYYTLVPMMPMKEMYNSKYLLDIDGNSFSGRYRALLLSTSLPIKATVYKEWHDSRLIPWAHFVPMDSLYMDIYGILSYFLGYEGNDGHDAQAEKIAMNGKRWAEQVLRHEDMQIYVFRLLLEYARLSDDRRDALAYVDDLRMA